MKMADRTFGVELEIINLTQGQCYRALRDAGIPARDPSRYASTPRDAWDIKEDCSISSPNGRSAEVVSPVLRGMEGIKQVRKVCRVLAKAGAWVNETCGLHVHVGATKGDNALTPDEVVTLITRYAKHERSIDRFVHPDRREDRGEFCQSMIDSADRIKEGPKSEILQEIRFQEDSIRTCAHRAWDWSYPGGTRQMTANNCTSCNARRSQIEASKKELERVKDGFADVSDIADIVDERYSKVNMQAYYDHGTIEFRQHNGALDPKTVCNWIRFVVNFVERSRALTPKSPVRKPKARDTGPLTGLPTHVQRFFKNRATLRTREFDAWA